MESIVPIKGKVKFTITLDSGVWIFDDRKVDLTTYFDEKNETIDELEEYTKAVSKHWSREIQEGATYPPTLKTEKKYEKEKILNGSFAIPFAPFLTNAEPLENAASLVIETETDEYRMDLAQADQLLIGFSKDGKPLKENGPVHIYYKDGSNRETPITDVRAFRVE
ncbi:peptidyl-prolyl cis-trans isomerase [Rossellomorea aquimaris]|uniref:Peptidyl-prolyl cis-trans isomerase n=1 Tax=Rossellomorea aquimaris TaxID=189382 RepID=A0A5D4TZC2_9BACI|nr:peptidyl-prolyl cis-trans isomerase [Rossellomorea aquimaris]TYS80387.1 peptidyl-prolyl cis-trans isomerase [Rossellomorea aquimaris]TYS85774.1 peptidyl-prolyl cis-trans isomerase [Rossellomorea aquimaris]